MRMKAFLQLELAERAANDGFVKRGLFSCPTAGGWLNLEDPSTKLLADFWLKVGCRLRFDFYACLASP